jgi:putative methyltransferase (TIGR04325 family)
MEMRDVIARLNIRHRLRRLFSSQESTIIPHYELVLDGTPILEGNVFNEKVWLESVRWYLQNDIDTSGSHKFVLEHYLSVFTAVFAVLGHQKQRVRILDFGGGMGNTCVPVIASLREKVDFEYHIVDTRNNCALGKKIFTNQEGVLFHDTIPEIGVDLLLTSSTIQYIEEWREVVEKLCSLGAQYVVFTRLPTTEGSTFLTKQNIVVSYGPHKGTFAGTAYHRFFNRAELKSFLETLGYSVSLDLFYSDYYSLLQNLPEEYRDCTLRTMLLIRN